MKRIIILFLIGILSAIVVAFIFKLITGEFNLVAPILGGMVVVLMAIRKTPKTE